MIGAYAAAGFLTGIVAAAMHSVGMPASDIALAGIFAIMVYLLFARR